ncbi:ABC transporter permease [Kyrpidia tusciae]|uniref:Binding-protein-dependent transport systems inner membrane component n=1 Tax=Kyrpidia tusciae (strain DSM 2912 / NBRC 15312 / T2) TaxID=562970 RepID=D5WUV2_KYRT2|nr:ABC transporter permease subunit [Kyrpidia tusciae]ADG07424.1 binding-protein-dependent transport systems inner membrane component [Kyrpidia tusciae DSM 2912]
MAPEVLETKGASVGLWKGSLRLLGNRLAAAAVIVAFLIVLVAILAPWLAPASPTAVDLGGRLAPPSSAHWFGTDEVGRDIASRILYGARISVGVGVGAVLLSAIAGTLIGSFAGYRGRWVDQLVMRSMDIVLAFPTLVLAMALAAALGPSLWNAALAIAIVKLPTYVRLARAETLSLSQQLFVRAARTFGLGSGWIVTRHIVPNALPPIIVQMTFDLGDTILLIATLGFLGLGAQPPTPEWGAMISVGWKYLLNQWWYPTFTGAAIFVTVMAFNLVGDGIRDLLDPRSRE